MSLIEWSWLFLVIYIVGMLGFGWVASRRIANADDFATARSSYGPYFLALAFAATTASGATFLGSPGLGYEFGMASVWARLGLPKWKDNDGAANSSGHNRPQVGITVPFGDSPVSVSATLGQDNKRRNCDDYNWYHLSVDASVQGFGLSAFYSGRGDRDLRCSDNEPNPGDEIFGMSISRGF